jgi:glycerophosphoryl diester phosphodiesterase
MGNGEAGRVFISYRRQETAWPARQLYDVLVAELGADRVFKDVDTIDPGDDFVERMQSAVSSCQVLLALIGPQWLATDAKGARRLDDPKDFVRLEVETALNRDDVRVIPILVDNAKMPTAEELPKELAALTRRQAIQIDPVNFDTRSLLRVLHHRLNDVRDEPAEPSTSGVGVGVRSPGTTPPVPRVAPATGTSDEWARPTAAAGPGSGLPAVRKQKRLLVIVATSIVLLMGVAAAVWYFGLKPDQGATPTGHGISASASSPPSVSTTPSSSPSKTLTPVDRSDILAHRGGDEKYPLETFESLTSAADEGFAVETDVRWTSDNVAVIVHDDAATQGVRCDRPYQVSKTTWKELRAHCHSFTKNRKFYPIATYANVMEGLMGFSSWAYVEVKVDQNAAQNREFINVIQDSGMGKQTVVTSNDLDRLAQIKKLAPDLPRLLFVTEKVSVSRLVDAKLWGVAVRKDAAAKGYITELKKAGLVVVVWTVNDEREWAQAKSAGADKVLTDKPRAYAAWLARQPR